MSILRSRVPPPRSWHGLPEGSSGRRGPPTGFAQAPWRVPHRERLPLTRLMVHAWTDVTLLADRAPVPIRPGSTGTDRYGKAA